MKRGLLGGAVLIAVLACLFSCSKEKKPDLKANPEILLSMGLVNWRKGNLDLALSQLQAAESKDSSNPDIPNAIGAVYGDKGDYAAAEKSYTRAIQLKSDSPNYYVNRGIARLRLKRHDAALADFDKALSPELAFEAPQIAFFWRGETYLDLQVFDKAAESYRAALARTPQDPVLLTRLGQCLNSMGQIDQALKEFEECAQANPKFAEVQFQMGRIYLDRTENTKACAAFAKYIELAPDGENAEPARRYLEVLRKGNSCPDEPPARAPKR